MIINKITTGFVIQQWDTEKKQWVDQSFVAGDDCDYEDGNGNTVSEDLIDDDTDTVPYLPFDMVQP